jgi:hypothetical protein
LHDDDDVATGDALRLRHPIWHAPGELARDSGSYVVRHHPCFKGHTVVVIVLETMAAPEDMLCRTMTVTTPLMMPFVQGILFGMHLVNLQETQVVCHQEHPCFDSHTRVGIILET